jgi:phosphatidylserine decarboxylase
MKIHYEGHRLLGYALLTLILLNLLTQEFATAALSFSLGFSIGVLAFISWFFRSPQRMIEEEDEQYIYAPADGRVVVMEEVEDHEYFCAMRLQISIFMSITDVHLNRVPVSGKVVYHRYHPGRYRVAWHPKASLENERSTVVIHNGEAEILLRQIAGAVARRIRTYAAEGMEVLQGAELGFIKFGSRLDILLPLDAEVEIRRGQKVTGNKTLIARLRPARVDLNQDLELEMESRKI